MDRQSVRVTIRIVGGLSNSDLGFPRALHETLWLSGGTTIREMILQGTRDRDAALWNGVYDVTRNDLRENAIIFLNNRFMDLHCGLDTPLMHGDVVLIGKSNSGG